ncbi:UvrD-helicase domain-containing protein, partial [Bacillus cereus]|nr:UvrD-helicase domain-containing protein [Bacillus cereus]
MTAEAASVGERPAKLPPRPAESTWTEEQWQAIVDGGENILVAAAAGSGKTAVLVERIIRRISDESAMLHVDQLLVATFTKAAAAEMRERIRLALERKLEENPDSEHLRRQLALLNRASITTLHSFCLEVIQRHFQAVQLDPAFRVANETEIELLRQDVLEELFEERYAGKDPSFARMVDWFSGERNDEAAFRLVQRLYDFSRSHPWPEEWLGSMTASFSPADIAELGRSPWAESIMAAARLTLNGIVELLRQAIALTTAPGGPEPYRA